MTGSVYIQQQQFFFDQMDSSRMRTQNQTKLNIVLSHRATTFSVTEDTKTYSQFNYSISHGMYKPTIIKMYKQNKKKKKLHINMLNTVKNTVNTHNLFK